MQRASYCPARARSRLFARKLKSIRIWSLKQRQAELLEIGFPCACTLAMVRRDVPINQAGDLLDAALFRQ